MRFDRESWRKLYVAESAEHRLMSMFARGLRDYLLRGAQEDGTLLSRTTNPTRDLARALSVEPEERKALGAAIKELLDVGYLTLEGERLWITKFEEAQESRSPGAKRQAKYMANKRAREGGGSDGNGSPPVTSPTTSPNASPGDVTDDVGGDVTPDETRRDETRREPGDASLRDDDGLPPRPLAPPDLLAAPVAFSDWKMPASLERYAVDCGLSLRQFEDVIADLGQKITRKGSPAWLFSQALRFIEQRARKNSEKASAKALAISTANAVGPTFAAVDAERQIRETFGESA